MVPTPEFKQVPETTKDTESLNFKEASDEELKHLADGIVNNTENQNQVKIFPDLWNSLNAEKKTQIAWQLTAEIQDSIKELSDLWVEYSSEVTKEDADNVAALEFVRENKDKIPQSWIKLEEKANEVAKAMGQEIVEKGILDNDTGDTGSMDTQK